MRTIRNDKDRMELIERLNSLSGDEKPVWGKMNINQMMSHLAQTGDLPFAVTLPDRSSFFSRTLIKPLILYVLPMPKEVKTPSEMNQLENGRKPSGFDQDRALVIDSINKIAALPIGHDCKHHPFFGKMSAKEWAVIAYKHTNHHLKQFGV